MPVVAASLAVSVVFVAVAAASVVEVVAVAAADGSDFYLIAVAAAEQGDSAEADVNTASSVPRALFVHSMVIFAVASN